MNGPFSAPKGSLAGALSLLDDPHYSQTAHVDNYCVAFVREHRVELERWFLEQAARKAAGATERNPVVVDKGAASPYLFESSCLAVAVGEDWRP